MSAIKQHAHTLIDALPDTAGWQDVARAVDAARFEAAVLEGIAAAETGAVLSAPQLATLFAGWGVDVAA
ncbi:hypothetical protein LL962_17750 [Xanthomonas sp. NCPPB 1067]|uniref:hypothetical protein n=1 Tax=Xanthomonas sp. NCPPB 1067 TaxID=487524 RepID=UPI001E503780|nr:hypothetical protein [Xanthomonas sp. NCPPB 1067]MCC4588922.1 hypothetical protein [Xanthomonas sp. NCPPB 1067]